MQHRQHIIHTLRMQQRCGTVSVTHDPITRRTTLRAVHHIAVHVSVREGRVDVYGLGDCGTFEVEGKRYRRFIEGSKIRVTDEAIFENKLRRSRFMGPSTAIVLPVVLSFRIRRLVVGGSTVFKELAPACIDESASPFLLALNPRGCLGAGLPVSSVLCTMHANTTIATATDLTPTSRLTWQLTELELRVCGRARVSGVHVTRRLMTTVVTEDTVALDLSHDDDCEVVTCTNSTIDSRVAMLGRAPSPPRRPVFDEHGTFEFVLAESRAAYDAAQPAKSAQPLFAITGHTSLIDRAGAPHCLVCMSNKAVVLLGGCGHTVTCIACTRELSSYQSTCPQCRAEIGVAVLPFISCDDTAPPARPGSGTALPCTP